MKQLWDLLEETLGEDFESSAKLPKNVRKLSEFFTEKRGEEIDLSYFQNKSLLEAYLAYYLPLNFHKVLLLLRSAPGLFELNKPQYWLDFGCGPGTASLAALAAYHITHRKNPSPPPVHIDLIDSQIEVYDLASGLLQRFAEMLGIKVQVRFFKDYEVAKVDLPKGHQYTLALAANVLNELPQKDIPGRKDPLLSIWEDTAGKMLVLEPSHRVPSQRLVRFRERLLSEDKNAQIIGPCTHREGCPVNRTKHWCHFSEMVADDRLVRLSLKIFNDPRLWLKFSYLYFRHGLKKSVPVFWDRKTYRAIGDLHPSGGEHRLAIDLCKPETKHVLRISSRIPVPLRKSLVRGATVVLDGDKVVAHPMVSHVVKRVPR